MVDGPVFGWSLVAALVILLAIALVVAWRGRLRIGYGVAAAAVRAVAQLTLVSTIIAAVMQRVGTSVLFAVAMLVVATFTASGRVGARRDYAWIGLALALGVLPVLVVVFALGAAAFTGPAIIPIAGIIIGGSMTAHTLTARRAFDALRSDMDQVEAALALGLTRPRAITIAISRHAPEALTPVLDQTRTVGLVTLPGAFVGVLLGGGSAAEAAAAQVLVLIGLLAAEISVVVASQHLIARGLIMPADLRNAMPPA